jgi:hypothetical protein
MVPCTRMYTYDAISSGVFPRSRAILCRAVPNPKRYDSQRFRRCMEEATARAEVRGRHDEHRAHTRLFGLGPFSLGFG